MRELGEIDMIPEQRILAALRAEQPGTALRGLVTELANEGHDKSAIVEMLEDFAVEQRARPGFRDADEDVIFDVLDALHGWCHPSAELLPERPVR